MPRAGTLGPPGWQRRTGLPHRHRSAAPHGPGTRAFYDYVHSLAGLVAYWRMDEASGLVMVDDLGRDHGAYTAPTLGQTGAILTEPADNAVLLDGTSAWSNIAAPTWTFNDTFTIGFWAKRTATGGTLQAERVADRTAGPQIIFDIATLDAWSVNSQTSGTPIAESINLVTDTNWHFYLWTKATTTNVMFFDAGVVTGTVTNVAISGDSGNFSIGRHRSSAIDWFNGSLDEYFVVVGQALSAQQVTDLYQAAGYGGGAVLNRTAADALTIADTATRLFTGFRTVAEGLTIADSATRQVTLARSASETLNIADAPTRTVTLLRSVANSLNIADAATRTVTLTRSAADTLSIADAATRIATLARNAAEALTISDAATQTKILVRSAADALNIADAATRSVTLLRSVTNSLSIADAATRTLTLARSAADALNIADAATQTKVLIRTAADALNIADVATRALTLTRSAANSLSIADVATRSVTLVRSVADSLSIADAATRVLALNRSVANSLNIADAATQTKVLIRSASDALHIADVASAIVTGGTVGIGTVGIVLGGAVNRIRTAGNVLRPLLGGRTDKPTLGGDVTKPTIGGDVED